MFLVYYHYFLCKIHISRVISSYPLKRQYLYIWLGSKADILICFQQPVGLGPLLISACVSCYTNSFSPSIPTEVVLNSTHTHNSGHFPLSLSLPVTLFPTQCHGTCLPQFQISLQCQCKREAFPYLPVSDRNSQTLSVLVLTCLSSFSFWRKKNKTKKTPIVIRYLESQRFF